MGKSFSFLNDYVLPLLELNADHITPGQMPSPPVFNAFAWGLIEEHLEWLEAVEPEQELKESGDVLAYATLLLSCVHKPEDVANKLESVSKELFPHVLEVELGLYSNLKRVNREKQTFDPSPVLSYIYLCLEDVHSFTLEEVALENIRKLRDRKARGVMFSGSGDNR